MEEKATAYEYRNAALRELGFSSYKEYLASEYWQKVKEYFPPCDQVCLMCLGTAQVLHHVRYDSWTLMGIHLECLAPLCHSCHADIELKEDKKCTLQEANVKLFSCIYKNMKSSDYVKEWFSKYTKRPRLNDAKSRKRVGVDKRNKRSDANKSIAEPGSFYFKASNKKTRKRHGLF